MTMLGQIDTQWLWWSAAALLGIAELIAPGFFLIWIGMAALVAGIAALVGVPTAGQFVLFGIAAVALVMVGRRYFATSNIVSADPMLNNRGARLVGSIVTAVEAADEAHGRVKVGDGIWSARGVVAGVGDRLRVTGADGSVLLVEHA